MRTDIWDVMVAALVILTDDLAKAGALSLLSVTVRITFDSPIKPFPFISAALTSRVYFGYFCDSKDILSIDYI